MSDHPADFRVEIVKARPQSAVSPSLGPPVDGEVLDVTDYTSLDDIGSINRAIERDLLTLKTGDCTLSFQNDTGFFDDLFNVLTAADVWGLRIYRRGKLRFHGVVIGLGSIIFNRKEEMVEVTAYGLNKLLDLTDASLVKRTIADMTVTTATAGATTMTVNTTAGLLSGDTLHPTDHANSEDVIVKQVTSGTVVSLEAPLVNSYAAGATVSCTTPFYRFKSIEFLVRAVYTESGVAMSILRISGSRFSRLAPTPVNLEGLPLTADAHRGMTETVSTIGGRGGVILGIHNVDDYGQFGPDQAWQVLGLPDKGPYDWSPYYVQGNTDAGFLCFEPDDGSASEGANGDRFHTFWGAIDYMPPAGGSPRRIWGTNVGTFPLQLRERTTVGGVVYTAATGVTVPADSGTNYFPILTCEYDPVRNFTYLGWGVDSSGGSNRHFRYRDHGGAAWVDAKQGDDSANTGYYGARYVADKDYVLVLRSTGSHVGPFEICAFRGTARLWKRPFPPCLIAHDISGNPDFYPTRTARFVNGSIYMVFVSGGAVQFLRTDDEFQTYTMRTLVPATSKTIMMACRVGDTYRIACYKGAAPKGYFVAAPSYAGVVDYADFDGLTGAEALKKLGVLINAIPGVDDNLQGSFIARDLYDPGEVFDLSEDDILERSDTLIWEETARYTKLSGNGIEVTAGDVAFAAEGIDLESSLLPNEAYAQALCDDYNDFYSVARRFSEQVIGDFEGRIYSPLLRANVPDFGRAFVYESDDSVADDEITAAWLEDR